MRRQSSTPSTSGNVIPLFARPAAPPRILRLSPECDGLELLYANERHPDKLFALKILCWAIRDDDEVVAMVPWLDKVVAASELEDPLNGQWEGYRLPEGEHLFSAPPKHKFDELQSAVDFFGSAPATLRVVQEIPDTIGTHAVFSSDDFNTIQLVEVVSWQLRGDGKLMAMVADEAEITSTPVLPGDPCLKEAQTLPGFRYFFQHSIANRIKERDPEALAALAMLGHS